MDNSAPSYSAQNLQESVTQRLYTRAVAKGEVTLPAVPAMIDEYLAMCDTLFASVGRKFSAEELGQVRTALQDQLAVAYAASPRSTIRISYHTPLGSTLHYEVNAQWWTRESAYQSLLSTREPPLLATEPDARVCALVNEVPDPTTHWVLDIGAGTGRNTLALARRGHPVDVVEQAPQFAEMIRAEAERESLQVRVIVRDIFSPADDLRRDYRLIVASEVVSDLRTTEQLRGLYELAASCLAPGANFVFNVFLARRGFVPDQAVREFGQQMSTSIFTWDEILAAAADLPLELVADDSVYDYEKEHLPQGDWPPTAWYPQWVSGLDLFPVERAASPIEMSWLVYQKIGW
ncbi:MAG: class I SAM-dependent methyltransferase [Mycobacteriaceae bacterium]|nr:class I SAM-dependent methyltransferase [Mycobacteriaceae bacterium]